jgi:spermidine dehydrogenase
MSPARGLPRPFNAPGAARRGAVSAGYDTLDDPDVPPEQRPHVIGRRRFGSITIANSDAGAAAFTNRAIDEAHRAVEELFVTNGLT